MPASFPATMPADSENARDDELLAAVTAGDAGAFGALFNRRSRDVYRFALHMTGSPAAADDITQEVFLVVIRDASRYQQGRATVKAWLSGIARNVARQRMDRERSYVPIASETAAAHVVADDERRPDAEFARTERIEAVQRAVLQLPFKYREVVVLCDLQEMSYVEAAAALRCAVGTVRSRLHRARALLAARLATNRKLTWMNECKLTI